MDFDKIAKALEGWALNVQANSLVGYFYMFGIIIFMFSLALKYRKEVVKILFGQDGKPQLPEIVVMIWLIIFPNIVLADVFLGLHPSDGVWWSMNCIMFFALTGHVVTNFRPNLGSVLGAVNEQKDEIQARVEQTTQTDTTVTVEKTDGK